MMYFSISIVIGFRRGRVSHLPRGALGEDVNHVLPTERAELPLFDIEVAGASPILGGLTAAIDVLVAQGCVEGAERLADGAILLHIDEVAGPLSHLFLCLFDKGRFTNAEEGGALLRRDDGDMAGDEGGIGGGDDSGFHNEGY